MSREEFEQLTEGDLVISPPYASEGRVIHKAVLRGCSYINIAWSDGQQGTMVVDSWQREKLVKVGRGE